MDEFDFKQMAHDLSRVHSGLQHLHISPTEPNINILADAMGVIRMAFNYFNETVKKEIEKAPAQPEETTEKE